MSAFRRTIRCSVRLQADPNPGTVVAPARCMRTAYPRHLPTFSYVGLHRYFLTWCTESRLGLFVTSNAVELVKLQILRAAGDEAFALLAYCFMPDHVHLLIEARSDGVIQFKVASLYP